MTVVDHFVSRYDLFRQILSCVHALPQAVEYRNVREFTTINTLAH